MKTTRIYQLRPRHFSAGDSIIAGAPYFSHFAYKPKKAGEITAVQAMKELGLSKATFYRMMKE